MTSVDLLVGKVGRAHGLRGDVGVDVRTDEPDKRLADGTVFTTPRGRLTVEWSRWHSGRLIVHFAEVPDRTVAETLRGTELRVEVPADERPDDPEEFYDHQLVGLRVETDTGEVVGEVSEVLHLPAHDLLAVRRRNGEVLVPFVTELVPVVDVDGGRLVLTDRPGLLFMDVTPADADAPDARPPDVGA
ncbi:MAG: ribosome maturation factor RimM [Nocardioidaceae bacterium]|jgi:16S rRNA processing protein RimM